MFNSIGFPRGVEPDKAVFGYIQALQGFPVEAIAYGIRRFLRGECSDVSQKYCPRPPELAAIVRDTIKARPHTPQGKLYVYSSPKSKILEGKCTKDWARQLVNQGVHPRGSIWCPGPLKGLDGEEARPDIGDLYGPDDEWKPAKPLAS